MEKTGAGVLLLFLSDFKQDKDSGELDAYSSDKGVFVGDQTNEAPVQYLLKAAGDDRHPIRAAICITTEKVRTVPVLEGKTAFEVFRDRLRKYKSDIEILPIDYRQDPIRTDSEFSNMALPVFRGLRNSLKEMLKPGDDVRVYIDYTGGFRDVSFLMTTIVRFLEFEEITVGKIVYSSYQEKRIIDITYIYQIMRLINGVDEFASTGNPRTLKAFAEGKQLEYVKRLMEAIVGLADKISLCQVDRIETDFQEVNDALNGFRSLPELEEPSETGLYRSMIKEMVPMIQKKMYLDEEVTIPGIIQWCIDNSLLQQAITLYVEKMPTFYFERKIFKRPEPGDKESSDPTLFYTRIYDSLRKVPQEETSEDIFRALLDKHFADINTEDKTYRNDAFWGNVKAEATEKDAALGKAIERLRGVFNAYVGNRKPEIYGKKAEAKKMIGFINQMRQPMSCYMHYVLYDDQADYEKRKSEKGEGLKIYRKKWDATVELYDVGDEYHAKLLRYYLAMKIIRNTFNHAGNLEEGSESQMDESVGEVTDLLKDYGIPIEMTLSCISKVVREGARLSLEYPGET